MITRNDILTFMINTDLQNYPEAKYVISNHREINSSLIRLERDEIVYITLIKIISSSLTTIDFNSILESRRIDHKSLFPENYYYDIITRHFGNIYFNISTDSKVEISYVKLKILKQC